MRLFRPFNLRRFLSLCLMILCVCALFGLGGCGGGSLFEPASTATAGDGKVPVKVVASATAAGNTANTSNVDYTAGAQVVFGLGMTSAERSAFLTRARTTGVPIVSRIDPTLGREVRIEFDKGLSSVRRNALLQRLGLSTTGGWPKFHLFAAPSPSVTPAP